MRTALGESSTASGAALVEGEAHAHLLGSVEGERFDRKLRERERSEREERLVRIAMEADAREAVGAVVGSADSARLRRQVDELASFHTAVLRSRGWRLLQLLRRPFGRDW